MNRVIDYYNNDTKNISPDQMSTITKLASIMATGDRTARGQILTFLDTVGDKLKDYDAIDTHTKYTDIPESRTIDKEGWTVKYTPAHTIEEEIKKPRYTEEQKHEIRESLKEYVEEFNRFLNEYVDDNNLSIDESENDKYLNIIAGSESYDDDITKDLKNLLTACQSVNAYDLAEALNNMSRKDRIKESGFGNRDIQGDNYEVGKDFITGVEDIQHIADYQLS